MKSYLDLISISAKTHRKQSKMTRICIILAVFLVAVMFGLADMYLQGATQKQMKEIGNWHYQLTSIDEETATLISARPEITVSGWQSTISAETGYLLDGHSVAISGQDEDVFEDVYMNELEEGSYPHSDNEIVLSSALKDSISINLGDTLELECPNGNIIGLSVVGFLNGQNMVGFNTENVQIGVMSLEGIQTLVSNSDKSILKQKYIVQFSRYSKIADTISDIKVRYNLSDEQITANVPLLSLQGQMSGTIVNQIYQLAFILSIIVMITCVLMISSSLNSQVMQRTKFFGLMRCQGATKKQVMRFVRLEGLHWCKTSIPIGIALSIVVVWILSAAMRNISPQWFAYMPLFGISWISIVVSVVLSLITVLLAARSPAKKAAKVSPLVAVSGNAQQYNSFRKAANTSLFKIETALGIHQAKASRKNFFLMTGAFAVCITLFLSFTTLVDFMKNAMSPGEAAVELSIVSENNTCSIDSSLFEEVVQTNSVKRAYGRMFAYDVPITINGTPGNANLISNEEYQFEWAKDLLAEGAVETAIQEINQVLFVSSENSSVHIGDSITLNINNEERIVTVAGILSDSPLARVEGTETIICSEETFTGITGQSDYTIIDVQFKDKALQSDVDEVKALFTNGVTFKDQFNAMQQQKNLYNAFAVLIYGFLSIIVAITFFHIMNTVSMGISAKMKQYGGMRAIGMSNNQLIKMIIAEAGTYAVTGIIAGCIVGIPMHWMFFVSLITNMWGIEWSIPFASIALITSIVLVTTFLAVRGPAKHIRNLSIVDTISAE